METDKPLKHYTPVEIDTFHRDYNQQLVTFVHRLTLPENFERFNFFDAKQKENIQTLLACIRGTLFYMPESKIGMTIFLENFKPYDKLIFAQDEFQPLAFPIFGVGYGMNTWTQEIKEIGTFCKQCLCYSLQLQSISLPLNINLFSGCCYLIDLLCNRLLEYRYPIEFIELIRETLREEGPKEIYDTIEVLLQRGELLKPACTILAIHIKEHPEDKKTIFKDFMKVNFPDQVGLVSTIESANSNNVVNAFALESLQNQHPELFNNLMQQAQQKIVTPI